MGDFFAFGLKFSIVGLVIALHTMKQQGVNINGFHIIKGLGSENGMVTMII